MPLFGPKTGKINNSMSAAPKLALVPASRYYCDVNWSYHNVYAKFHWDGKRFSLGAHEFENNKVPLFGRKTGKINTSMSAAPKLALEPPSRYYCDVNWSYHNVCAKFH